MEIRNGPLLKDFSLARFRHIFLPRTVIKARNNPDITNRWTNHLKKLSGVKCNNSNSNSNVNGNVSEITTIDSSSNRK